MTDVEPIVVASFMTWSSVGLARLCRNGVASVSSRNTSCPRIPSAIVPKTSRQATSRPNPPTSSSDARLAGAPTRAGRGPALSGSAGSRGSGSLGAARSGSGSALVMPPIVVENRGRGRGAAQAAAALPWSWSGPGASPAGSAAWPTCRSERFVAQAWPWVIRP